MIQRSEQLPFLQKTVVPGRPVDIVAEDFDGHPLLNLTVRSLRQIDRTHPAGTQNANSPIGSPMWILRGVRVKAEKGFYFGAQLRSDLAFSKEFLTLASRQVGDLMKKKAHDRIHRVSKLRNV